MTQTVGQELEVVEHDAPRLPAARVQVAPEVEAAELVKRLDVIKGAMQTAMQPDVDYGVIPGTGTKPTLLKPGAEKLGALFQLDVQLDNEKIWHDDGHLTVVCRATVFHQPTGARLGSGEGICSTREGRYAFRNGERSCPSCGAQAIIKGKQEYGGGWLCWNRKGGCGAKYADGDPAIEGQQVGKIPNENISDCWNTVDKMASKRARVDAVLAVTGASAIFTQDVEDLPRDETPAPSSSSTPPAQAAASVSDDEWRWPSGKHQGKTLEETDRGYIEWYAAGGPKADVKQRCARWLAATRASEATCGECGGVDGAHRDGCPESVPF